MATQYQPQHILPLPDGAPTVETGDDVSAEIERRPRTPSTPEKRGHSGENATAGSQVLASSIFRKGIDGSKAKVEIE